MRIRFQERPWDLYFCFSYTVGMSALLLIFGEGNLFGILLLLFVPGYALAATLFPSAKDIEWTERLALSFGLSIAVVPLLGLLLNFTPLGIRFAPMVGTIATFTIGFGLGAYWRRVRLQQSDRLSATIELSISGWKDIGRLHKLLIAGLAASTVLGAVIFAYLVAIPGPNEHVTQFYILGPAGNASGYPTALNVSQPGSVILGIANHESASVNYTVRIDLVAVQIVYNATSGFNETIEVNRTTWSTFNVSLADGRNWTRPYTFQINYTGLWKVQFLLFRDGDFSRAYQEVHLSVRVT